MPLLHSLILEVKTRFAGGVAMDRAKAGLPPIPIVSTCIPSVYFLPPFTATLSVVPALKAGTFEASIFSASPVLGLRPVRMARLRTSNVPKPTNDRDTPRCQSIGNDFKHCTQAALGVRFAAACLGCQFIDEFFSTPLVWLNR